MYQLHSSCIPVAFIPVALICTEFCFFYEDSTSFKSRQARVPQLLSKAKHRFGENFKTNEFWNECQTYRLLAYGLVGVVWWFIYMCLQWNFLFGPIVLIYLNLASFDFQQLFINIKLSSRKTNNFYYWLPLFNTLMFEALYYLKLCPIFVTSLHSFDDRYRN